MKMPDVSYVRTNKGIKVYTYGCSLFGDLNYGYAGIIKYIPKWQKYVYIPSFFSYMISAELINEIHNKIQWLKYKHRGRI